MLRSQGQLPPTNPEKPNSTAALVRRTVDNFMTSYFTVAAMPVADNPRTFLASHHEFMKDDNLVFLHALTHPPGGVLFYRAMIGICDSFPSLTRAIFGLISRAGVSLAEFKQPLTQTQLSGGFLGAALILLFGALSCWPLAALAEALGADPLSAARAAMLWTLTPALVLMGPALDELVSFPIAVCAWGLFSFCSAPKSNLKSWLALGAAGLSGGIALQLTYGSLMFLPIVSLAALAGSEGWKNPSRAASALTVLLALCLLAILFPMHYGHRPIAAFLQGMTNHHRIIGERTYFTWLFYNPLDFAIFLGFPVVFLAVYRFLAPIFAKDRFALLEPPRAVGFRKMIIGGMAALIVTGVARGEVGRIWMPMMPFVTLCSALGPIARSEPKSGEALDPQIHPLTFSKNDAMIFGCLLLAFSLVLRIKWIVP